MTIENIQTVSISEVYLDELNPRLPTTVDRQQKTMLRYIARNTSITELMTVIAEHGYFPGEPIVVIPRDAGGYWVVEGNRRLTALKLLNDPSLVSKNARIRDVSETARYTPDTVPCVIFEKRSEIVNYLGYRHISGVKQWEPLAKARYIAQYFTTETDEKADPATRYREVARGIGSQAPYIKRQLDGIAVYYHMEDHAFYDIEGLTEETISFSLLSTATGYDRILNFVSLSEDPFLEPDFLKGDAVHDLAIWMYQTNENGETILGDSRNIQRLAVIVENADAVEILRNSRNLQKAFAITKGVASEFYDLLNGIEWGLEEAVSSVALIDLDEGHRSQISNIFKQARALRRVSEDD